MKKLVLLTFALVLALSMAAFATGTRVLTMGQNDAVLLDESNQWMYTGRVFMYPNIATAEFWSSSSGPYEAYSDMAEFGINWKFGEQSPWVLGTYFSTGLPSYPTSYDGISYMDLDNNLPNNRRINLLYGRPFGGTNFGFHFGYTQSGWSSEEEGDDTKESFGYYEFSFGLTPTNGQWDVAAHIGLGSWTDEAGDGTAETDADGYMDVAILGRYLYQYNPTMTFIPHATFAFGTHGESIEGGTDTKSKLTAFELGAGMNYTPTTNVLAVIDFGVRYLSIKNEFTPEAGAGAEEKNSEFDLPFWKIGLEGEVLSWMDVRFGATSDWSNFKYEDGTGGSLDYKWNSAENQTYLGVGLHFGRLHLDTYTDPELLLDGLNFISGSTDVDDLNFRVTALYELQ